jgi:HD-GYP domain-containing protein (c-di-GMP phosphodiesterase class II)
MTDRGEYLDLSFLDQVDAEEGGGQRLLRDYLAANYVFVKSALVFELNNSALHNACDRIAAVANQVRAELDGASIEFLSDGVYINRDLVKLDSGGFEQGEYLFHIWKALGIGAVEATNTTSREDWLALAAELKRYLGGLGDDDLSKVALANIKLVELSAMAGNEDLTVTDRFRALRAHSITAVAIGELIEQARSGSRLKVVTIKRPVQEMISVCHSCASLMLALVHMKRNKLEVQHHLANTAVLVICAARHLGLSRSDISELAVQAALHGLGRAFTAGADRTSANEREHEFAMESVCKLARTPAVDTRALGRVVVANEIRRWATPEHDDGYPFELSTASRLITVAHAYDLLTTPRPEHPALLPDEALRVIIAEAGRRYDETAVRLLVNELGVYPVGSLVALSSGESAIVVEAPHDTSGPERPRVKIIRDTAGNVVDGAILDLAGQAGGAVSILHCLDAEEEDVNPPAFLLS